MADILIFLLIALYSAFVIRRMLRKDRSCKCSGCCTGCSGCSAANIDALIRKAGKEGK